MTTLAEHMIVASVDNHPPMLEKTIDISWASRMILYIKGKEHGRLMLNSVLNVPLVYPTIEVDGVTRPKTYEELLKKENFKIIVIFVLRILFFKYQALISHLPSSVPQHAYQTPSIPLQPQAKFPQLDSGLVVLSFLPGDDPIASLNKVMAFLSTSIALRFPTTNNQLRSSSNLRNQALIQDAELLFNKFGEDIVRVMLVKKGLSSVIVIREKGIWLDNALSQRGQGTQHGLRNS
nr:hypothetical protein [Tanacetum cinerariifolium]